MDRKTASELAISLMEQHGLYSRVPSWTFQFDNAARRFGFCSHHRRLISLSAPLAAINSDEEVRDTILHEIAHALVGPQHGHDAAWLKMAASIGAKPQRCADASTTNTVPGRYEGKCSDCGKVFTKHKYSRSMVTVGRFHAACRRRPNRGSIDSWTDTKTGMVYSHPKPKRTVTVRANYFQQAAKAAGVEKPSVIAPQSQPGHNLTQAQLTELWQMLQDTKRMMGVKS